MSVEISEGVHLLLGRNGSGKTSLLKIIAGLLEQSEGEIYFDGEKVEREERLEKCGYVFQNPQTQVIGVTVEEDIAFGLENVGMDREEMKKRVEEVLKEVSLWDLREFDPSLLSGGQLQRLAMASIIALNPSVLLLDEPISMLDPDGAKEVVEVIRKVSEGRIVIIATHDVEHFDFADSVLYLSGSLRKENVRDFFRNPPEDVPVPSWI